MKPSETIAMQTKGGAGALPLYPRPLPERLPRLLVAIAAAPAVLVAVLLVAALRMAALLARPRARPLLGVLVLVTAVGGLGALGVDGPGVVLFAAAVGAATLVLWMLPGREGPDGLPRAVASTWMPGPRPDLRMLHLTGQPGLGGAAAWEAAIRFDRHHDDVFGPRAA